jgi:hypothetical protein
MPASGFAGARTQIRDMQRRGCLRPEHLIVSRSSTGKTRAFPRDFPGIGNAGLSGGTVLNRVMRLNAIRPPKPTGARTGIPKAFAFVPPAGYMFWLKPSFGHKLAVCNPRSMVAACRIEWLPHNPGPDGYDFRQLGGGGADGGAYALQIPVPPAKQLSAPPVLTPTYRRTGIAASLPPVIGPLTCQPPHRQHPRSGCNV